MKLIANKQNTVFGGRIIYQTQEESTASASAAFRATSKFLSHFLCASEVKLTSARPFYSEGLGLWRRT